MSRDLLDRLADADPAHGLDLPDAADQRALCEAILAEPRPRRAPTRARWWPRAGLAAAASLLIVALAAGVLLVDLGAPAVVATPPLRVPVDAPTEPADELLLELADAAEASGREAAPGRRTVSWGLSTAVSEGQSESEVLASSATWWLHDDGTATRCRTESAAMDVQLARAQTTDDIDDCDEIERLGPDEHRRPPALPGDTPQELIEAVTDGPQDHPDHLAVADAYVALNRSLSGEDEAVWLRALAETGKLSDYGPVTDRAGREARAVGFVTDFSGLPNRHLLMLDPDDGQLLASEQTLTERAGSLDVEIPSVITYGASFDVDQPVPE